MLDKLPLELRTDILSRLPVDSLLRFRCVSKLYCAEIDNPNFIKTHFKRSLDTGSNLGVIFADRHPDFFYSVSFDSPSDVVKLDYPLRNAAYSVLSMNIKIVGSCNGLLCFINGVGRVGLLNPATRKSHTLPILPSEHTTVKSNWGFPTWSFGFGYDPVSDDYKVVRLSQSIGLSSGTHYNNETMIYSLKSNSWRSILGMTYLFGMDHQMGLLVNDALHWLVDRNRVLPNPRVIVGLDLKSETYREMPEPELIGDPNLSIGLVGGWLSLSAIYEMKTDIWVMKAYGVKESWTKFVSITPSLVAPMKLMRISPFSENGDEMLIGMQGKNVVWYNVKEKNAKIMEMPDVGTPYTAEVCHGSLVSLKTDQKGRKDKVKAKANRDDFLSKGFKLKL